MFSFFNDWIGLHFPKLDDAQLEALRRICLLRNLEAHEPASLDVNEVSALARGFLDAFLETGDAKARSGP